MPCPGASADDNAHPINVADICYDVEREFDGFYDPARSHTPAELTMVRGISLPYPFNERDADT